MIIDTRLDLAPIHFGPLANWLTTTIYEHSLCPNAMQWEWFVSCEEQDRSLFQLRTSRTESRVNGQDNYGVGDDLSDQVAARSFIRGNRFSLCCFVDGLQLSEYHFHHPPNAHSAKTDDSTSVQFETFSHPENFLGHLTPPSVAG